MLDGGRGYVGFSWFERHRKNSAVLRLQVVGPVLTNAQHQHTPLKMKKLDFQVMTALTMSVDPAEN